MTDNLMADYYARRDAERAKAKRVMAAACSPLQKLGVARVEIEYDGYGDSGTIQNPSYWGPAETSDQSYGKLITNISPTLSDRLVDAAESLLSEGWEINEGSYGYFVLLPAERQLTLENHTRVAEHDQQEWSL